MKLKDTYIKKGSILISAPQLSDFFSRTVILMMEHNENGSLGFVLNKPVEQKINEIIEDFPEFEAKLSIGGPVETDIINFIHKSDNLVVGGLEILDGIFWGGNFNALKILAETGKLNPDDFLFFLGYSGWSAGQLNEEMLSNTWFVSEPTKKIIFETEPEKIWSNSLRRMGGEYLTISSFPSDPSVN